MGVARGFLAFPLLLYKSMGPLEKKKKAPAVRLGEKGSKADGVATRQRHPPPPFRVWLLVNSSSSTVNLSRARRRARS